MPYFFIRFQMVTRLTPSSFAVSVRLLAAWLILEQPFFGSSSSLQPLGGWIGYGLLVGIAGMAGDLAESLIKRELGAKDSGQMLGGLGGVLDLIDSLLFAAPVAWLLWVNAGP